MEHRTAEVFEAVGIKNKAEVPWFTNHRSEMSTGAGIAVPASTKKPAMRSDRSVKKFAKGSDLSWQILTERSDRIAGRRLRSIWCLTRRFRSMCARCIPRDRNFWSATKEDVQCRCFAAPPRASWGRTLFRRARVKSRLRLSLKRSLLPISAIEHKNYSRLVSFYT